MQSIQTIGIDLQLKMLVWRDAAGHTRRLYNDPNWIAKRHGLGQEAKATIDTMSAKLDALAKIAAGHQ